MDVMIKYLLMIVINKLKKIKIFIKFLIKTKFY